jgi:hypothetical protein
VGSGKKARLSGRTWPDADRLGDQYRCMLLWRAARKMSESETPINYQVAGLVWRSELELPGYWQLDEDLTEAGEADVLVSIGEARLPAGPYLHRQADLAVTATECFFVIADVADFLVRNGRQIIVQPHGDVQERDLRAYTMGTALGAILHQRGDLPLHASCVRAGDGAACFIGQSGAGKSTLAATLNAHGHDILCDDIAVIRFDQNGLPFISPTGTRIRLWQDALDALSIPTEGLERDFVKMDKYHLTGATAGCPAPVPLKAVFVLKDQDAGEPAISPLRGLAAAAHINENVYRYMFGKTIGRARQLFSAATRVADHADIYRLTRAKNHEHEAVIHSLSPYLRFEDRSDDS